ncbi:TPA: hypothetical protein JJJ54_001023 [Enterococcus faecalis]|jgi:hypothetical protein|uniref:hypothetical protein n=1 Tax=Enterococcus faecalis TaxID=1351 RepID=UPI002288B749|nr:hypothetical protein [Enterococcus faecalis]HAW7083369.1 hypothetical protein [Enterococcus faecalis]HAW7104659.1 hypothetical protein [Enterococcus faecalis]HCT9996248.1 hypothetical protein [Enterococcus faecalis]
MSKLNQLIGFLEEQLTVSEPTPDYTRHNQEIITYIEYLKSMKQPQLNENQQIVLDWLKEDYSKNSYMSPFGTIYDTIRYREIKIRTLSKKEQAEVLQIFSRWAIEQEEG